MKIEIETIKQGWCITSTCCEAIVNTVNCVGVCGKGIALTIKEKFPYTLHEYYQLCKNKKFYPGMVICAANNFCQSVQDRKDGSLAHDKYLKYIFHFASKDHWKDPSKLEWVEKGIDNLCYQLDKFRIKSLATVLPGTGLGGLDKKTVKQILIAKLEKDTTYLEKVELYE